MHRLRVSLLSFLGEIPLPLWREEPKHDSPAPSCHLSEHFPGEPPRHTRPIPSLQQERLPPRLPPSSHTRHKMIIQLSSTLDIISVICRHVQKKLIHVPCLTTTEDRNLIIIIREHVEPRRSRGRRPAQLFSVGGKSLSWMGHGNCTSMLVQVMNSCGGNMIIMFLS